LDKFGCRKRLSAEDGRETNAPEHKLPKVCSRWCGFE
jgi:hypothetical protein